MLKFLAGILVGAFLVVFAPRLVGLKTFVTRPAPDLGPSQIIFHTEASPRWIQDPKCTAMNEQERTYNELTLKIYQDSPSISWMTIGATKFFGQNQYRGVGKDSVRLCPPIDLIPEITKVAIAHRIFAKEHLFADELRLARFLGPRDPAIVKAVARTAFYPYPIYATYPELKEDVRPLARIVLAEFGDAASDWSEKAFSEMGADDALQLTAVDIAITTKHPEALQKVVGWMEKILERNSDPIPRSQRNTFYHLAYAMAGLGADARDFIGPVLKIMDRKVQSWAPPFGMISLPPRRMCRVLELIGGPEAGAASKRKPCFPAGTLEQ